MAPKTISMAAASNLTQDHASFYDPEDVVPRNSPILAQHDLKLRMSPSPPPVIHLAKVSPPPSPDRGDSSRRKSSRRKSSRGKVKPSQGDAFLLNLLGDGRDPEIARHAAKTTLVPSSESDDSDGGSPPPPEDDPRFPRIGRATPPDHRYIQDSYHHSPREPAPQKRSDMNTNAIGQSNANNLMSLAAGALAVTTASPLLKSQVGEVGPAQSFSTAEPRDSARARRPLGSIPPAIAIRENDVPREGRLPLHAAPSPSPYTPHGVYPLRDALPAGHPNSQQRNHSENMSPTTIPPSGLGELPPIQPRSPESDVNSHQSLPSLKDQLGDLNGLNKPQATEHDRAMRPCNISQSPPGPLPQFSHMNIKAGSPPVPTPTADNFPRDLSSPNQTILPRRPSTQAPSFYHHDRSFQKASDYSGNPRMATSGAPEQPGLHPIASPNDRLGFDAMAPPQPPVLYVCKVAGCTAPPFQTQYLLNSHANVHSSSRPHFCPIKDCPRSFGGKGFKRKNEMIRHGLVHDSPGYVCPFCPDREHRYPRPDNLQRHVRVHHVDKSKDDALLREVLAQRPDGPSRGRRRRGGPS